jgi:hypothetical protein
MNITTQINTHHPAREEIGEPELAFMPPGTFGEPDSVYQNRCFPFHLDIPFSDT